MMLKSWALSADFGRSLTLVAVGIWFLSVILLFAELRIRRTRGTVIGTTGVLSTTLVLLSVLRPASILSRTDLVGPRVVVLADSSRSMDLPAGRVTRRDALRRAVEKIKASADHARLSVLGFGDGPATTWDGASPGASRPAERSDLTAALTSLARAPGERPGAIIVLSDGRLDRPTSDQAGTAIRQTLRSLDVPVHTVGLVAEAVPDASIRAVRVAGAAVAHQALPLTVEIGCDGGIACKDLSVSARELVEGGSPALLASGIAHVSNGASTVELRITLEHAGSRIVEVRIDVPDGDQIPENNVRLLSFDVARDRVRVLHVAGRPTYDVRALRTWLKSNASVDVVAFFILRTAIDEVNAADDDLALIPFPVHELFSEHLSSFDAVVLQDFDAAPYGLLVHLPALARYVQHGGGLIMVGGPNSFAGGHYASTHVADVLPVAMPDDPETPPFDLGPFVPWYADVARGVPALRPVRSLLGDALPEMAGANRMGDARSGTFVLWTHPKLRTSSGAPMPILALGEHGDGRSIALAVDSTYRLAQSAVASETGGRAHGALWDGLLGWLMRDSRYEPADVGPTGACMAGVPLSLSVRALPDSRGDLHVEISSLGSGRVVKAMRLAANHGEPTTFDVDGLEPGGYAVRVRVGDGPATRRDFACERGGDEWADSRPDEPRLRTIAAATGGHFVAAEQANRLPIPKATEVTVQKSVMPLFPAWVWCLCAALASGAHWIARRRGGLI
jgi:uncharacterized membrane protein